MRMGVKKEITVGQIFVIGIAVLTFLGAAWTTYSEVQQLKKDVVELASAETVVSLRSEVSEMRQDLNDIRNLVYYYVRQQTKSQPDTLLDRPVMRLMARIDSSLTAQ